jgi:hypothetical protein
VISALGAVWEDELPRRRARFVSACACGLGRGGGEVHGHAASGVAEPRAAGKCVVLAGGVCCMCRRGAFAP